MTDHPAADVNNKPAVEISDAPTTAAREADSARGLLDVALAANRQLEQELAVALSCLRNLHQQALQASKESREARASLERIQNGRPYRLGSLLTEHLRHPRGWLRLPAAIWHFYAADRSSAPAAMLVEPESLAEQFISPGMDRLSLPLTLKPQMVTVEPRHEPYEIWVAAAGLARGTPIELTANTRLAGSSAETTTRRLNLLPGKATLLLGRCQRLTKVELELRRAAGPFCLLILDIRTPAPRSETSIEELIAAAERGDFAPSRSDGTELDRKLWGGYAQYVVPMLERLRDDTLAKAADRREAAWHLTRWFYHRAAYDKAAENARFSRTVLGRPEGRFVIAEAQSLLNSCQCDEVQDVLSRYSDLISPIDLHLLRATLMKRSRPDGVSPSVAEAAQLEELNRCFTLGGLATVQKKDATKKLTLDNILAVPWDPVSESGAKVSVVVPAYNAAQTIRWAVESLLLQSWTNLEIVVVDDASTDETAEIVSALAGHDPRIVLVRKHRNQGAYAARNDGLRRCTGTFITTQDSDDWSHPQRIELQARALEDARDVVAVRSHWIRVTEALEIVGPWAPNGSLHSPNFSSLLVRREVFDFLGPWDEVRVGADSELYARIRAVFGERSVVTLPGDQLLALSLVRPNSLTQTPATHMSTIYHGLRWLYRDCYVHWHKALASSRPTIRLATARAFPAPALNLPAGRAARYDLIVVADFADPHGCEISLGYISAARSAGLDLAVLHWPSFYGDPQRSLGSRLYDVCQQSDVALLSWGDRVESDVVLCTQPSALQYLIAPLPQIDTKRVVVLRDLTDEVMSEGLLGRQYDTATVEQNIHDAFGKDASWRATSSAIMNAAPAGDSPWIPVFGNKVIYAEPPPWRGGQRPKPVVGIRVTLSMSAGRPHIDQLRALDDSRMSIRLLYNGTHDRSLGGVNQAELSDIEELDFYVELSPPDYEGDLSRFAYQALASGVPVLVTVKAQDFPEDTAIYCTLDRLTSRIAALWRSEDEYFRHVAAGKRFAATYCSGAALLRRLQKLHSTAV